MHSMDLYVRSHVRGILAGFSRWRVSMLLKMEMKVCHWVNGALFFVLLTFSSYWFRLTVPLCSVSTDALAPDTNRYLFARVFHLAPHPPPLLLRFRFHFRFLPPLIRLTLPRILSGWQRRSNSLRVEITDQWGKGGYKKYCFWNFRWAHPFHFPCSTIFPNVNFVQLIL